MDDELITERRSVAFPQVFGYLRHVTGGLARHAALVSYLTEYCQQHELNLCGVFTDRETTVAVRSPAFVGLLDALELPDTYGAVVPALSHLGPKRVAGDREREIATTGEALRDAFTALEAEAAAGTLTAYGVATWDGFDTGTLSVPALHQLAIEAAGSEDHHLRAVQLPVSLVAATAFAQALDGEGPIAQAAELGWQVYASAHLFGGEVPQLATHELTALVNPHFTTVQACLLAAASCPGVTRVLLSASAPAHWAEAQTALQDPAIPVPALRKVLDVLAAD